uniref:DUF7260 family protein n=2 Tax=Salinarchaeum laminariae TaxID=869888 RepID=UPI0020BE3C46|nr:hypothetical protein [Salinarchaeum laminariae]
MTMVTIFGVLAPDTDGSIDAVRRAPAEVNAERDRLLEEYEAFTEFADRVEDLSISTRSDGGRSREAFLLASKQPAGQLQSVRDAYRDTVMAVDHFDTDYDESLEAHLTAELSPEIASSVIDGTHLTATLRRSIVAGARNAVRDRHVVIERLADERTDLQAAADQLAAIAKRFERTDGDELTERTFPDIQTRWQRLHEHQEECEALLARRQQQVSELSSVGISNGRSPVAVSTYLFDDLDVDFPVLDAGTKLLEQIDAEQRRTVEALTERRR